MGTITIDKQELKDIIKESVRDIIKEERISIMEMIIPKVSNNEMKKIERLYGKTPSYHLDAFQDMTDWVKK